MKSQNHTSRIAILSGLVTAVGIVSPAILAIIMTQITNRHGLTNFGEDYGIFILVGLSLIIGGLWGESMARVAGITRRWRVRIAGALTFNTAIFLTVLLLTVILEGSPIETLPQHQVFLIVFPLSAFNVSMLSALGLHIVNTKLVRALRNALLVGLVSGLVFLIIAVVMDVLGYRIGTGLTGRVIDLPPMPFVTLVSTFIAALFGGGLLGVLLSREATRPELSAPPDIVTEQQELYA